MYSNDGQRFLIPVARGSSERIYSGLGWVWDCSPDQQSLLMMPSRSPYQKLEVLHLVNRMQGPGFSAVQTRFCTDASYRTGAGSHWLPHENGGSNLAIFGAPIAGAEKSSPP